MPTNILLTSAGRRTYLVKYFKDALNGLGRVHAANSCDCPAFHVADECVLTPQIYDGDYIPFLLGYCTRHHIDAIVPLFDIDIPVLADHAPSFAALGTTVVVPEPSIAQACNDKLETMRLLEDRGIAVPHTVESTSKAVELLSCGELSFPLIVKPRWGMGSIGVHVVRNAESLQAACTLIEDEIRSSYLHFETERGDGSPFLIQEMAQGEEYGLDVICDLSFSYVMTSVKKKLGMRAGETDSAITVDSAVLRQLGARLAEVLPHPGVMDVDVIVSGGAPVVLEANARFGGGYPFTHVSGVNVPAMIVTWLHGSEISIEDISQRVGCLAYKDIAMRVQGEAGSL